MIKRIALSIVFLSIAISCVWAQGAGDTAKPPAQQFVENAAEPASTPVESSVEPAATMPVEVMKIAEIGMKFDSLNPKGWVMPFPTTGETITQDFGGIRTALAKRHIGFFLMNTGVYWGQSSKGPSVPATAQSYNGQRPTWNANGWYWLTYNPSPTLQFVFSAAKYHATFYGDGPSATRIGIISFHKELFDGKLVLEGGYKENYINYFGMFTGGSIAGSIAPAALIPFEVGESIDPYATPSLDFKYNFTKKLYIRSGIQRSLPPSQLLTDKGSANNESLINRGAGLRFLCKGCKPLFISEVGYRQEALPGQKLAFYRVTGFYNRSKFMDYREVFPNPLKPGLTDNNWGFSISGDKQIWQKNKYLPFQGLYVSGTVQYAPPQQNIYSQYYEVKAYTFGLLPNRPMDMTTFAINRENNSNIALTTLGKVGYGPTYKNLTQVSGGYMVQLMHGLFINNVLSYTEHPSPFASMSPKKALIWNETFTVYF
ncbi:MAG TPA: carbohydrate porin [Candidatus Saccharimonadales bacterium]|nr:carbohydrate porin [Candidatus Saccharimonadales bacterium]